MKAAALQLFVVLLSGCDTGGPDESRATDTTVVPATPLAPDQSVAAGAPAEAIDPYGTAAGTGSGPAGDPRRSASPMDGTDVSAAQAERAAVWNGAGGDTTFRTMRATGTDFDPTRLQEPQAPRELPTDNAPTPAQLPSGD